VANNFTPPATGAVFAAEDRTGVLFEKVLSSGATTANAGQVAITTSTTTVRLAQNLNRRSVAIRNTGTTTTVNVSPTSGFTITNGFPLNPGESMTVDYNGNLFIAVASGTGTINYWEDVNG
jgi:hypothetical protein